MSHKATDWAFDQKLPALQKLVLIVLADRHNKDTGRCDPSMDRISEDCGMSKDSVKRSIKELCDKGLITAIQRKSGTVNLSNFYTLNIGGVGANSTQGGCTQHLGVGADSTSNQEEEPVIEPVRTTTPSSKVGELSKREISKEEQKQETRARRELFVDDLKKYWQWKNKDIPFFAPTGKDFIQIDLWLKGHLQWTPEMWRQALKNRGMSDGVAWSEDLFRWISRLDTYFDGPKDRYGKTKTADGGAKHEQQQQLADSNRDSLQQWIDGKRTKSPSSGGVPEKSGAGGKPSNLAGAHRGLLGSASGSEAGGGFSGEVREGFDETPETD